MNASPSSPVNRGKTVPGTNSGSFTYKTNTAPGGGARLRYDHLGNLDISTGFEDRPLHDELGGERYVHLDNSGGKLDPGMRFDYLEIAQTDRVGRLRASAQIDLNDTFLSSAVSTYGPGYDEEQDEEAALEWLNKHSAAIDNVLAEDYGASLDDTFEWDSQQLQVNREFPLDASLSEAVDAVCDDRAEPLHEMVFEGDFAPLFAEAEKHVADRETTREIGGRLLDSLTNTVGNDIAQRARYATVATVWDHDPANPGQSVAAYELTAFDSTAKPLGAPIRIALTDDTTLARRRFPSDMTVPESDPNEPLLLNVAQNSNSVLDLDKVGGHVWGRAKA